MSDLIKRNELSVERLRVKELYVTQMRNLERILDEFRFNLSKTKALMGFALAETGLVNSRDLDPSQRSPTNSIQIYNGWNFRISISCNDDRYVFSLEEGEESTTCNGLRQRSTNKPADKKEDAEESGDESGDSRRCNSSADRPTPTVFRPFGLLEPNTAKLARQNMKDALPLVCELASLQQEIRCLNVHYHNLSRIDTLDKA